jgi:hypothetical protein
MRIYAQDVMLANSSIEDFGFSHCAAFTQSTIDSLTQDTSKSFVVFCSLQMTTKLRNHWLHSGIIYTPEIFHHSYYSSYIRNSILLNSHQIYLPFGHILTMKDELRSIFGDSVFIKPDSGSKAFTGFSCAIDKLEYELSAVRQLEVVYPTTMCMIAKAVELYSTEWRVWVVGGKISTYAPYSWETPTAGQAMPAAATDVVLAAISDMEIVDDTFVVDVCSTQDSWKVVELNAMSTSGFYAGMSGSALQTSLRDIIFNSQIT